jgi:hypothetical protein
VQLWLDGPHSKGRQGSLASAKFNKYLAGNAATKTITGLGKGRYTVYALNFQKLNGLVSLPVSAVADVT